MDLVSAQPSRIRGNEIMLNWQQKNKIKSGGDKTTDFNNSPSSVAAFD